MRKVKANQSRISQKKVPAVQITAAERVHGEDIGQGTCPLLPLSFYIPFHPLHRNLPIHSTRQPEPLGIVNNPPRSKFNPLSPLFQRPRDREPPWRRASEARRPPPTGRGQPVREWDHRPRQGGSHQESCSGREGKEKYPPWHVYVHGKKSCRFRFLSCVYTNDPLRVRGCGCVRSDVTGCSPFFSPFTFFVVNRRASCRYDRLC